MNIGAPKVDVFAEARSRISRSYIEAHFSCTGSYWVANNFQCLNPMRADSSIGSFSIRDDGRFHDFANGDSGDIFDLLAAMNGCAPVEVARELIGFAPSVPALPSKQEVKEQLKPDWKPFVDLPSFKDPQPSLITTYYSAQNERMFIIVRRDTEKGKEILPMYYTGGSWIKGLPPSLGKTRPMLPIDDSKTIVIVEGEKCAVTGSEAFSQYSFTTWHGGAGAARMALLDPLSGCDVILWPDNDDIGQTAMLDIAERLAAVGCRIRMVSPPRGVAKGWDIADCLGDELGKSNALALLEASREISSIELGVEAPESAVETKRNATDLGNAERFADRYGSVVRFNSEKKKWVIWSAGRWSDREQSSLTPMVKETVRSMAAEDEEFALECESRSRISSMLDLTSREPGIAIHETDFDVDPMILNCANGMINLKSGLLEAHDPSRLCSMATNVEHSSKTTCPRFLKFMEEITCNRPAIIEFLQRWFGYALTGDVSAQTFAIFYGNGANGKSTLVELISRILGDYVRTAPPETFIQKPVGGISNDVASLRGSRLVLATETDANARLAESKIKGMTGGDTVVARFLHGEFFSFQPTWKIIISTNHRPRVSGADYGIWRRIILVPFDFIAAGEALDCNLAAKLWEERHGIFNWIIEGCLKWQKDGGGRTGLKIPEVLLNETQDYREDEDIVGRFIRMKCITVANDLLARDASQMLTGASDLFKAFIKWAEDDGERFAAKMTQTGFGRAMRERGFVSEMHRSKLKVYYGIQINRTEEQ